MELAVLAYTDYMRNMYLGCHAIVVEILVLVRAHLVTYATVERCNLYPEACI